MSAKEPNALNDKTERARRRARSAMADWWKIIAMGVLLAGLVYLAFFHDSSPPGDLGTGPPVAPVEVEVPRLDQEILDRAKDATREQRLLLEPEPLAHLLEKSLQIVPSVAQALGVPDEPIPLSVLRASPDTYRGTYLAYEGRLGHVSPGKPGHPIEGYKIHEGWIELDDGDKVLFQVSLPPATGLEKGSWCRVEGYFLKLRDSNIFPQAEQAPLLVGPELFPEFEPWPTVTELDPGWFADIRDGLVEGGNFVDLQDSGLGLEESQDEPLWRLGSYARHRAESGQDTLLGWRAVDPLVTKDQLVKFKYGQVEPGTPVRLLGTFVYAEYSVARPNPIDAKHWTQAWIQIRDLGGKVVPVWIPKRISGFQYNESLEVRAYYFRRYLYDAEQYGMTFTPLFVAADLHRFEALPEHALTTWVKYGFAGLVGLLVLLFILSARRDRLAREQHELDRIARRQKRLHKHAAAASSDAMTPG